MDSIQPTNDNGLKTLMCVTDLVNCCQSEGLGNWYYPNGSRVTIVASGAGRTFRTNRGQNEVVNGTQFYGSLRLWQRYIPLERGLFYCQLPDAQNVVQSLYVNICELPIILSHIYTVFNMCSFFIFIAVLFVLVADPLLVAISPSQSASPITVGMNYSLTCSATLYRQWNPPIPDPAPSFEWFFGEYGNALLPTGATPTDTVFNSGTYTSTLQLSPLNLSYAGTYTCRLGAGRLVNNHTLTVTGM